MHDNLYNLQENEFDGLHRRIVKQTYIGDGQYETRHYYYNQAWQVVEERVGADPATARVDAQYVWHPDYIDSLAMRYWDSNASGGPETRHYYLQDANYNVTAVTDNAGSVVERYAYTPYGTPTVLDDNFSVDSDGISDISNVILYTGRERDPETGLQLSRKRFYAPHLGRWLNRDPLQYAAGLNMYSMVRGRPVNRTDPFGLRECTCSADGKLPSNSIIDNIVNTAIQDALADPGKKPINQKLFDLLAQDAPGSGAQWNDGVANGTIIEQIIHEFSPGFVAIGPPIAGAPTADAIIIDCNGKLYSIGSDKLGHFFQQGHMMYEMYKYILDLKDPVWSPWAYEYGQGFGLWMEGGWSHKTFVNGSLIYGKEYPDCLHSQMQGDFRRGDLFLLRDG